MNDYIRIGKVSSINGSLIRVTYPDRGDTVTTELPLLSNGTYRIPNVGETVVTVHLSSGTTDGICLGGIASSGNDFLLSQLYTRFTNLENRVTALEQRIEELGG